MSGRDSSIKGGDKDCGAKLKGYMKHKLYYRGELGTS